MGTTYRHVTLRQYLPSILAEGLDPACSTGKQPLVWLHTLRRTRWALLHTLKRHRVAMAEVVILDVRVPRRWIRRTGRGLWTCNRVIAPERIRLLPASDGTAARLLAE